MKSWFLVVMLVLFLLPSKNEYAVGDIYRYEDSDGFVHFDDAQTDNKYKIFMKDIKKEKTLRDKLKTNNWFSIRRDSGECASCDGPAPIILSSPKARVVDDVIENGKPVVVTVYLDSNNAVTFYKTIGLCKKDAKRLKHRLDRYR